MRKVELENKTILVTGSAGFIGSNLVKRLFSELGRGTVVGIDNMNAYYDVSIKEYRLAELDRLKPEGIDYYFIKGYISDRATVDGIFGRFRPAVVVNLAAQAGVRYSIETPDA
ncbi:MAG: GDP-mannose 4,6-dehydratase, partial [Bacteroidales bacterium]|nr:GDP-mannose 4,6-dehydratase [Bacteroidales bacterium]